MGIGRSWAAALPKRFVRNDGTADVPRIKSEASIVEVASEATELVRSGDEMKGLCPFHAENTPSFFVNEAKGLFHCFGCDAHGDVIDLVSHIRDVGFAEACAILAGTDGASRGGTSPRRRRHHDDERLQDADVRRGDDVERASAKALNQARAKAEWHRAVFIDGTPVDRYLTSRLICEGVPSSIRSGNVPRFWRDDGTEGPRIPAMIAAVQDVGGGLVGIHRTFLDREGRKHRWGEPRLALGRVRGGAVRLGPVRPAIMLCVGIEDGLALRLMFPGATVWAATGDANLPAVILPDVVRHVTVCGDEDASGHAAVAAARKAFEARGVGTTELFPHAGAKDFSEEWALLHA